MSHKEESDPRDPRMELPRLPPTLSRSEPDAWMVVGAAFIYFFPESAYAGAQQAISMLLARLSRQTSRHLPKYDEALWQFPISDYVKHVRTDREYQILAHALDEHTKEPVYVYVDPESLRTWVRGKEEMEDGRFSYDPKNLQPSGEKSE